MEKYRICPRCESKDVKFEWQTSIVGLAVVDNYTCNKCGYTSTFFPESKKSNKKISK